LRKKETFRRLFVKPVFLHNAMYHNLSNIMRDLVISDVNA